MCAVHLPKTVRWMSLEQSNSRLRKRQVLRQLIVAIVTTDKCNVYYINITKIERLELCRPYFPI